MPQSEQLSFRKTVAPLTRETVRLSCRNGGIIKQVLVACPFGPGYLVEIQVKCGQTPILPTDGSFFTIDNSSIPFPLNEVIKKGEVVSVEWINHDSVNNHTIPVVVSIIQEGFMEDKEAV